MAPALSAARSEHRGDWRASSPGGHALIFGCFSVIYFAAAFARASAKLPWFDELLTIYLSRLPARQLWTALATSAPDHNPPLIYLLTRLSVALFGDGNVAVRLPAITGFWLLELSLYIFVARRTNAWCALFSVATAACTAAAVYSFEARAYGVVLGLCGLALLCWQSCASGATGAWRRLALAGLTLSLAAALGTHYFGFLLFLPIAAGELVRTLERKRPDPAVWASLALGAAPIPFLLPLLRAARTYATPYWAAPHWSTAPRFYVCLLGLSWMSLIPAGAGYLLTRGSAGKRGPFRWEWVAAGALAACPAIAVATAWVLHSAAIPRYALPATAGFPVLAGFWLYGARARKWPARAAALAVVLACAAGWVLPNTLQLMARRGEAVLIYTAVPRLPAAFERSELPIVVSDPQAFLQLSLYGPPSIRRRVTYLADFDAARRRIGMDNGDRQLAALGACASVPVKEYAPFVRARRRFLFYGEKSPWSWQFAQLQEDGAVMTRLGLDAYEVSITESR